MIWHASHKNGRVIYEQRGPKPSDDDKPIGMMDTAALAARVVDAVNALGVADTPGRYERKRGQDVGPPLCHECGHSSEEHCEAGCLVDIPDPDDVDDTIYCPCRLSAGQIQGGTVADETDYLTANPANASRLQESIARLERDGSEEWAELAKRHELSEDWAIPLSCLLGRCAHGGDGPSEWFTRDELTGIADDGVNRMERAKNVAEMLRAGAVRANCACIGGAACGTGGCPYPKGRTFPRDVMTAAPASTSATDSAAVSPDMWSDPGEAGLEPKEWHPGEPAATEDIEFTVDRDGMVLAVPDVIMQECLGPDWRQKAWAHMPAVVEKMGLAEHEELKAVYDGLLAAADMGILRELPDPHWHCLTEGCESFTSEELAGEHVDETDHHVGECGGGCTEGPAWTPEQRRLLNKAWLDLMVKGETFIKVQDGKLAVGDPAAPEDVVVVELARGGIVKSGPYIAGEKVRLLGDWAPGVKLDGMFSVPEGIRQALGEGSGNVKVTVTGPGGEALAEVINRTLKDQGVRFVDSPILTSHEDEVTVQARQAMLNDWATRMRESTGRWPAMTGWVKGDAMDKRLAERTDMARRLAEDLDIAPEVADLADGSSRYSTLAERETERLRAFAEDAVELVLPDIQRYFEAEMRAAGLDPTGLRVHYDMAAVKPEPTGGPRPIVDIELPDVTEYRDPDAHVAPDSSDLICNKCGTVVFTEDDGWVCDCDSAMFEHMRPEADDDDV